MSILLQAIGPRGVLTCSDRCLVSLATVIHASSRKSPRSTRQADEEGLIVKTIAFCTVVCAVAIYFAVRVFTHVRRRGCLFVNLRES